MSASLTLPAKLDLRAAAPLRDDLISASGGDLVLDARDVQHLGSLSLQVIRSAARTWSRAGHALTLANVSSETADQLALLGFTPDSATAWEAHP